MSRRTQARCQAALSDYAYGGFTLSAVPSQALLLSSRPRPVAPAPPYNPSDESLVWALPSSLAATGGISFDFSSCWYLDGSLPSVSRAWTMYSSHVRHSFQTVGLPHSETRGSSAVGAYPRLFAAIRVLHRLAAPRHPRWTHIHLTILFFRFLRY